MTVTPQDVQTKLDSAVNSLEDTRLSYPAMVKKYGPNWKRWPQSSNWYKAFHAIATAREEAGQLTVHILRADFAYK